MTNNAQVLFDILRHRRAVRKFLPESVPPMVIEQAVEAALLAPSSSNLQLWEYYHITDTERKDALVEACMGQPAARTAPDLIVVVTRHDLWRERCHANLQFIRSMVAKEPEEKPIKAETYFRKTIPMLYFDWWGIIGWIKAIAAFFIGMRRPMYREVRFGQVRAMGQKSVALSAQTFMIALAAEGYDSCPMEGLDSRRVKSLLDLPSKAEINMVIACGKRAEGGIYTPRFRLPKEKVFFRI